MCIIFINIPSSSDLALVLAMNREESFWRPTLSACWHEDILAGWDMTKNKEYGTWLAMNKRGDVAFLTNLFTNQMPSSEKRGRGNLVTDILKHENEKEFLANLAEQCSEYNTFNLGLLKRNNHESHDNKTTKNSDSDGKLYKISYLCSGADYFNRPELEKEGPCSINMEENKEMFIQSNHPPSKPYVKSIKGRELFEKIVEKHGMDKEKLIEHLFRDLLTNKECFWPDNQILRQTHETIESLEKNDENKRHLMTLSSIFYPAHNNYGTRMQTIIIVDKAGKVDFVERHRDEKGKWTITRHEFECEQ